MGKNDVLKQMQGNVGNPGFESKDLSTPFLVTPDEQRVYNRVCSMAEVPQVVPADRPAVITLHGLLGLVPFRFMIAADDKQERNLITASWLIPSFPAGCHESTQNGQKKKEAKARLQMTSLLRDFL